MAHKVAQNWCKVFFFCRVVGIVAYIGIPFIYSFDIESNLLVHYCKIHVNLMK